MTAQIEAGGAGAAHRLAGAERRPGPQWARFHQPAPAKELPAWPVLWLVGGFGLWWVLGAAWIAPTALALVMVLYMLARGARWLPGLGPWLVLTLWVAAAALPLMESHNILGYAPRLLDFVDAAVVAVYAASARQALTRRRILGALTALWVTMVALGCMVLVAPDARLTTPFSFVMPQGLLANDLVGRLVNPPLAEVQNPYGALSPFNRPAAPFPYANSWGLSYAMLTPAVIAWLCEPRPAGRRRTLTWVAGVAALLVSLAPALGTSNRGMLAGLTVAVLVTAAMAARLGRPFVMLGILGTAALALAGFVFGGGLASILSRLKLSSSTADRLTLYERTFDESLKRPFLGHSTPRLDPVLGVPLGTQGMIWFLMFCFGFPAVLFLALFFIDVLLRGRRVPDLTGAWAYGGIAGAAVLMPFYSVSTLPMIALVLLAVVVLRHARAAGRSGETWKAT